METSKQVIDASQNGSSLATETSAKENIIIVDTNVLIHDPDAISKFKVDGNLLVIPLIVILELDKLKKRPGIGFDAREVTKQIKILQKQKDKNLKICRVMDWQGLDLDRGHPDHQILAMINRIILERNNQLLALGNRHSHKHKNSKPSPYSGYNKVKFISKDTTITILATEFFGEAGLLVEDYQFDQVVAPEYQDLPKVNVKAANIDPVALRFKIRRKLDIEENGGVICSCNQEMFNKVPDPKLKKTFVAIKKGDSFQIVNPNINIAGIRPFSINGKGPNWEHYIAMHLLTDREIDLVFLQGGAGSGKTLLAMAAAISCRENYKSIIVARPVEPIEGDKLGFFPGGIEDKLAIWRVPIDQAISFIKEANSFTDDGKKAGKNGVIEYLEKNSIPMTPLDYIRGTTFHKAFMIIDEGQNLTPHMVKTIITRAGNHTKMVLTGDLGQIDHKNLDSKSSGLAYGISRMRNHNNVGVVIFKETVRSPLAEMANRLL